MIESSSPITEEDLHAYVDGFLDPDRRAAVEAYLHANVHQRSRVEAWKAQNHLLRMQYNSVMDEPIPPELNMRHVLAEYTRSRWFVRDWTRITTAPALRAAAALVIALGLGTTAGWVGRGTMQPAEPGSMVGLGALKLEMNAAYRVMSDETSGLMVQPPVEVARRSPLLSGLVGSPVSIPDLSHNGYRLVGTAVMATAHGPAGLVLYRDASGRPLVLMVRRMEETTPPSKMVESRAAHHIQFTWIRNGVGFAVAADRLAPDLHHTANQIRRDETSI